MDAKDVREEIATRLRTIEGLNVSAWPIPTPIPPVAVVVPQGVTYDQTYGRGSDEMNYNVLVFIGKPNDRSSTERLDEYMSGSGTKSIKAALETEPTLTNLVSRGNGTSYLDEPSREIGFRATRAVSVGTYSLLTGQTPPAGTDLTTAVRYTMNATDQIAYGFHILANPETVDPDPDNGYPVGEGQVLTVSGWVRLTLQNPGSHVGRLRLRFMEDSGPSWVGGNIDLSNAPALTNGQWVRLSNTVTVPSGATHLLAGYIGTPSFVPTIGDTIDATGLMVTEGSTLYDYRDGNSDGWRWAGSLNESPSLGPLRTPVFDSIHVASGEWDVVSVNGNEFLTAIFDLTVIGRGE